MNRASTKAVIIACTAIFEYPTSVSTRRHYTSLHNCQPVSTKMKDCVAANAYAILFPKSHREMVNETRITVPPDLFIVTDHCIVGHIGHLASNCLLLL